MNHSPFPAEENTPRPIGLSAFDSLRAEDEPWLAECYVPPPDFTLMAGWRSVLIFGGVGSGRTALRLALERHRCPPGQKPSLLLVRWPMSLVATTGLTGTALVEEQMRHVLDAVVRAILQHLLRYPADWGQAPAWAQDTLIWFVHRHLRGDVGHHLASLEAEAEHNTGREYRFLSETGTPVGCHARLHEHSVRDKTLYKLPLLYPDRDLLGVAYVKRVYGTAFVDGMKEWNQGENRTCLSVGFAVAWELGGILMVRHTGRAHQGLVRTGAPPPRWLHDPG